MRPAIESYRVLSDGEVDQLHDSAVKLLEDPGMRIENEDLLRALESRGARVDYSGRSSVSRGR